MDEAAIRALARDEALRVVAQQNAARLEAERRRAVTAGVSRVPLSAVFSGIAVGVVFTATVAWPQPTLVEHFVFLAALAAVPVALAIGLGWGAAGPQAADGEGHDA